ncbi:MAG: response regulator [Reichenbachiella sp.]|uniref:response regulator n=1 Tax=Reichenbachiella sp. TaxID=2184521 RepID=UPI003266DEED
MVLLHLSSIVEAQSEIDSLKHLAETTTNERTRVEAYIKLCYKYHRVDAALALSYATQAETIATQAELEDALAYAKFRQGTVLIMMDSLDQAETVLKEAQIIFDRLQDGTGLALVKIEQARIQQRRSNIETAIRIYLEALPLLKETDNKNTEARVLNYLGSLYRSQKQPQKAIEYYEQALDLVTTLDFKPGISACLMNLSTMFRITEEYEKSISYLEESIAIKRETGDKLGLGRGLENLAKLHATLKNYEKAENFYQEALTVASEVNDSGLKNIVLFGLAENHFNTGNYHLSIGLSREVLTSPVVSNDLELQVELYAILADSYEKIGDVNKAYTNAKLHNKLSDSLYNEQIVATTNDLEAKYQNEQKAKEIAVLESENKVQQLQIQSRMRERNYLLAFVMIALLLIGLIYNQYRGKQKSNAKLKELDQLKSEFLANISHEFRTPLSLIIAPLKDKIRSTTDPKEKAVFDRMHRNAEDLYHLINQLLDLSKLEHGQLAMNLVPTEAFGFFRVLSASFTSLAEHSEIHFKSQIPEGECWMELDPDVVQKVCYNLLSNAFKFTPEKGEIMFKVEVESHTLKITVSDTGIGILAEDQEKVFDRFFQSSNTGHMGTGIGLALTKQLVNIHNGDITLLRSDEKGTTFGVQIPLKKVDPVENQQIAERIKNVKIDREKDDVVTLSDENRGPVVLVIEDNEDLSRYLKELLRENYTVHMSSNGMEGVEKAKELVPDLIISDVMMPKKDGIEVCNELKEAHETDHIPIILLTALADRESKLKGLERGADDYLLKPFDPKELAARVSNLLSQRSKLKEKYVGLLRLDVANIEVSNREEQFLKKLMEVIGDHLSDSAFSVEQLSSEVAMSRMQLHRKLTALTGQSASTFVRNHRLNQATRLLLAGETATQVAYAVGFSSPSYFTRAFKEVYGVAPSEYAGIVA